MIRRPTWTVSIARSERLDGEKPFTCVLRASNRDRAIRTALRCHHDSTDGLYTWEITADDTGKDDIGYLVLQASPGLPPPDAEYWCNDLRGFKTIAWHALRHHLIGWRHRLICWLHVALR